jgi:oxygen-independent coproporphyrinogen-3 oxidase
VDENPEITLEANPMICLSTNIRIIKSKINLSIGIQSFFEDDLKMMNRAHNSAEAQNV